MKRYVRNDNLTGYDFLEREYQEEVTDEVINMVLRVMKSGEFSRQLAITTLLRSAGKQNKAIENCAFYLTCKFIDDNKTMLISFPTIGALASAVSMAHQISPSTIHKILTRNPFDIPQTRRTAIRTKKYSPVKELKIEKVEIPKLKNLFLVNQLFLAYERISSDDLRKMGGWQDFDALLKTVLKEERDEIERKLGREK